MKKRIISLLSVMLFGVASVLAVPAAPYAIEMTQPDGSTIMIKLVGDEYASYETTEDGVPVVRGEDGFYRYATFTTNGTLGAGEMRAHNANVRTAAETAYLGTLPTQEQAHKEFGVRRQATQRAMKAVPSPLPWMTPMGNKRVLVILTQFQDKTFATAKSDISDMLNKDGYDFNGSLGSVRDYFIDQSNGQFAPTFDVVGPVTLDNNLAYYGADGTGRDSKASEMLKDACDKANSEVNFADYDSNGDGKVDLVCIIYAGYAQSSSNVATDIWPMCAFGSLSGTWDGKSVDMYLRTSELTGSTGTVRAGIGTFIHEFSHTIGLADWYDTNGATDGSCPGMGNWSIMHSGNYAGGGNVPVNYTAYERTQCGWMTLDELPTTGATLLLENLADGRKAYRMSSSDANQYFVLENRQQTGWDKHLASSGLLIYKVDYDGEAWYWDTVNTNASRPRMTIMPADNEYSNEAGDLYPYGGNNSFTKSSTPASVTNTAGTIDRPITNIMNTNGYVSFEVNGGGPLATPVVETFTYSGGLLQMTWSMVAGATSYNVKIYRNNDPTDVYKSVTTGTTDRYYSCYAEEGYVYTVQVQATSTNFSSEYSTPKSVTAGELLEMFAVTFATAQNGTFEVQKDGVVITSGTTVLEGTVLKVVATPDEGYHVDAITVNGTELVGTDFTVSAASTVVVTFVESEENYVSYCIPETTEFNYSSRSHVKTLTFSANGTSYELNLHPSDEHDAYLDFTEEEPFRVDAGATISVTYTYSKASYFNYGFFYVDWNKDGELEQVFKTSNTLDRYNVISFAVPSDAAGAYRARFQVDNSGNTDPCALVSLSTNYTAGSMTADFIVYIGEAPAPESYAVNFGTAENGTFRVLHEGTAITSGTLIEEKTTLTVETTPDEGYQLDVITVNGSEITGNTFEVKGVTTVAVTFKEREAVEYTTPTGAMHSNGKTYVEHIYTENAYKNVDKTWTSAPSNVYQLVDGTVEVERGYEFNLHLDAYSMGASSTTAVRQDLRYTTAVIFSDWDCDGVFTQEQVYGSNPPAHNVTGNMEVMEINKTFTVPADAYFGESRIRVIYSNAWGSVPTADMQTISDGMAYDIVVKVSENLTTAIESVNSENKIYAHQGKIVVKCNGEQRVEVINLMGQTVLSTVVNNNAMFNMPAQGVYIVRCGEQVNKVVVQ